MLLAIAITGTLGLGWHTVYGPIGPVGGSLYATMYLVTLSIATGKAVKSRQPARVLTALWIIAHYIAHAYVWAITESVLFASALYIAAATPLVVFAREPWQYTIAGLFLFAALAGALTRLGLLPPHWDRPDIYIAYAYPDVVAFIGHAANVVLGTIDTGRWSRFWYSARSYLLGIVGRYRPRSRLHPHKALVEKQGKQKE